ncbi:bifunctional phosphoribosylaminoimidazolecarboxamide formyltransferase/IMP cyclohydrolase [Pasteurella skyensis]|uniref:Bifunctional purine biosynthesis protein PurH n=1 Tax=Phocoenobacter skyensis TaxID=97481 RepID=A0AAJ6P0F1_9PAST|nr:bifunctional phosphoribosylaminoimidazolecarboxamide formyltransferase/IMP cyclohydrolase [Pasteurella skyensis]MDP8162895.1 bifunctional phosphoribosylaminoimidazolecarboxamide formyltransferase/IMP cyclohydrolase [Pasteurella skyensis]MDP8172518.1 bifunctional phosphoribosylaminoimidazolecarboxamide formyltransferase/IMP cyclohydrolase [Pasteurella skyensis]MDP8177719.1 bifunctional phosphoribosylaminoimidazolecarboxamide formyltransferase/IMP cyclohydrolase [Pasteurella skyensis]MDP817901
MKRALISVYDKEGIVELAEQLVKNNIEIISTGGTYQHLLDNGVPVLEVSQVIESDEMLDGRVKTLHPHIHGGILAIRDNAEHMQTLREKNIATIDFVIVNLYPFFDKVKENLPFDDTIEFIDIGGPTMLRSAAKSFKDVVVITDKKDYQTVIDELNNNQTISYETRKFFARKVFNLTACYDAAISQFLLDDDCPEFLTISYQKESEMRYGENSHQKAVYYVDKMNDGAMKDFTQLNGKALSFNNIRDMDLAWKVVCEFNETEDTACCAVKHSTPCGVAIADSVETAYNKAYECDPVSIFGGIVAFNREVDESTAKKLKDIFLEIVIAPGFSDDALTTLKQKKNLRVIKCNQKPQDSKEYIKVDGGLLVQDVNNTLLDNAKVVTNKQPSDIENKDLLFALKVVKYVKSNAIVIAKDGQTLGIGGGEVSRIWATEKAIERANAFGKNNMVLASDAFFPFSDVVGLVSENAITAIIQPGGSIRDQDSIDVCNKKDIAMVFSQLRHFKH